MQPQGLVITKKRLILAAVFFVVFVAFIVMSGYSTISIEVSAIQSGKINYTLHKQGSKYSTSFSSNLNKVSRIVKKGSYELAVSQNNNSAFAITKSHGFFLKTNVSASLVPRPARQFVGNGPSSCMYYVDGILYSYDCQGATSQTVQMPATATTPSYGVKTIKGVFGAFDAVAATKLGIVALFNTNAGHLAYVLGSKTQASDGVVLKDLDSRTTYNMALYRSGFIVYDKSFADIKYYSSLTANPENISINGLSESTQEPESLSTSSNGIAVTYSDKANFDTRSDPKSIGKVNVRVFLYVNNQTKIFNFDKPFSNVVPCGSNKLCLLDGITNELSVYDVSNSKSKLLYILDDVRSILAHGQNLLVVRGGDIINLNVDHATGSIAQDLRSYRQCGLQDATINNYLLCIANKRGQNYVLLVDPGIPDTDNIDGKVAKLLDLDAVKAVSPSGKYIFISANAGDLVRNAQHNDYEYDPVKQKIATDKINQTIKAFGAGNYVFKITNGSE